MRFSFQLGVFFFFRFVVQECTFQSKKMELLTTADASFEELFCQRSPDEWMNLHTGLGALENENNWCAPLRVFTGCHLVSQNNVDSERG